MAFPGGTGMLRCGGTRRRSKLATTVALAGGVPVGDTTGTEGNDPEGTTRYSVIATGMLSPLMENVLAGQASVIRSCWTR